MPTAGTLYQPYSPSAPYNAVSKPQTRPTTEITTTFPHPAASLHGAGSSITSSAIPSLSSGSYRRGLSTDIDGTNYGSQSVDLIDMITDRLGNAINPTPLDRSLAQQAQSSGELNAKQRELAELQAMARRRLRSTRNSLAEGMKAAKEVRKDLEWTQNRVNALNVKAASKYPSAYQKANSKIPSPSEGC